MLKELIEVLACIASFISGDYLDEQPNEWYTRCNDIIEDKSICYEQMTEEEFNIQWQKEEDARKQLEAEQREIEYQQRQEQWQEISNNLNRNDIDSIIAYMEYFGKDMEGKMEELAKMLNADYRWKSTIYGANGNRNVQYIDIDTGVTISFTNQKTGDKSIHVYRENYEYVYSVTYEYEK